jgi:4-diphosphocytidyl-2-C-methyl-D-erythritol kinase
MLFQRAFAKINLGLRVIRVRGDGYHDLETVFHRVDIFDDLAAYPDTELSLDCDDPTLAADDNLVLVAARALREKFNVREGARLTLTKRIPHGAGLGGGSSDAAAALRLLARLWNLEPAPGDLESIALSVGSDVPYFLGELSAHATSRGERLSWFPLVLPCTALVVAPAIHVSTRRAFQSVVPRGRDAADDLRSIVLRDPGNPGAMRGTVENDFEGPVFRVHPGIGLIRDRIYESGADFALMSGSGSSVFGLYTDERAASRAAGLFAGEHRVFLTPPGFVPDLRITEGRMDGGID